MKLSKDIQENLLCPLTKGKLTEKSDYLESVINPDIRYPIIDGIPILINDKNSLFSIDDFVQRANTTFDIKKSNLRRFLGNLVPTIGVNIKARQNFDEIAAMLPVRSKILVIGGSIMGEGMDTLYAADAFELVGADVSFGPHVKVICDAHDLTFEDELFDCVVVQAVLEHVLDPQRCVREIHRVLKPAGLVYAETPFMQQVHMKQYDFTRFSHLGHRRLFRCFEEIKSGPACGPGMALAYSYTYFLRSFASAPSMVRILTVFARLTSFFWKYFDYYLIDKPGSFDAASGYFFMGRKSNQPLADRELMAQFRGVR